MNSVTSNTGVGGAIFTSSTFYNIRIFNTVKFDDNVVQSNNGNDICDNGSTSLKFPYRKAAFEGSTSTSDPHRIYSLLVGEYVERKKILL
jgi:hypothetical protein